MSTTRSTKGLPSSSGAHFVSTAQVRRDAGWLCFNEATAGSVWRMSPMAPRRTTRIRVRSLLPAADIVLQLARAQRVGRAQTQNRKAPQKLTEPIGSSRIGSYHVVYHA